MCFHVATKISIWYSGTEQRVSRIAIALFSVSCYDAAKRKEEEGPRYPTLPHSLLATFNIRKEKEAEELRRKAEEGNWLICC